MADTKISAAADVVTVLANDRVAVARSGSTTAYCATMAEVATYTNGAYTPNYYVGAPAMDGTASAGTSTFVARGDHVHPSDTSRLALAGGTLTGALNMATVGFNGTTAIAKPTVIGSKGGNAALASLLTALAAYGLVTDSST